MGGGGRKTFLGGDTSCRWDGGATVVTERRAKCSHYPSLLPLSLAREQEEKGVQATPIRDVCTHVYIDEI